MYRHTRTWTGAVAPINYSALARGIEVNKSHSVVTESQASNSSIEKEAFVYMINTPEETTRCFEQQAQVQRELLAQRPITLVLMMINSCSYSTNDLMFN